MLMKNHKIGLNVKLFYSIWIRWADWYLSC